MENNVSFETQTHSQQTPDVQARHFSISGRGVRHPVSSFNDTSTLQEADVSFFGSTQHSDDPLAVNKEFSSKESLNRAINDVHIHKSIEVSGVLAIEV